MSLREATREIIKLVEEKSGFPVQVTQDPKLPTIANVRIARGNVPTHFVAYKPYTGEQPDYAICQECVYILRKFAVPQGQRFDIAGTERGKDDLVALLNAPGGAAFKYGLKGQSLMQLRDQLMTGLIVHLLSVPLSFRASAWMSEHYPDFGELQKKHVEKELATNKDTLDPKIKDMFPPKVFKSTQAINGAFALYWSQKYDNPRIFAPYRFDFRKLSEDLLQTVIDIPDDPGHDQELIDAWGSKLGLTDWYTWVPYQLPA